MVIVVPEIVNSIFPGVAPTLSNAPMPKQKSSSVAKSGVWLKVNVTLLPLRTPAGVSVINVPDHTCGAAGGGVGGVMTCPVPANAV